ncbi:MAG: LysR family transcriptional regulator [Solirubrobacteraceae bacterium]
MQYFVAVAEELHFCRAAARLHIAQPSLSHEIRKLEQHLGVTLLDRSSRRVELTPAGRELLAHGRRLLADSQRAISSTRKAATERLTVGFYGSAGTLLPDILTAFAGRHPAAEVSVRELLLGGLTDILNGNVDVAFTRLIPGQAEPEVEVIATEQRLVALPRHHPLAARQSLTFAELRDESFITNPADRDSGPPVRWLTEQQRHGLPGRVAAEAASVQEILTLVASGRGVCLVPAPVARHHPRPDVSYIQVTDADPALVSLAWARGSLRPVVDTFIEVARQVAARDAPPDLDPDAPVS